MTMTDPIADMLTRIRNANKAQHDSVTMPGSKLKEALAGILQREGYIASFDLKPAEGRPGSNLTITLKYDVDRRATISGLKRVSKPGLRIYAQADNGVAVLSTSAGLMTDREARKRHLGGEVLCHVW